MRTFLGIDIDRLLHPRRAFEGRAAAIKKRCDERTAEANARAHELREKASELDREARAAITAAEARAAALGAEAQELRESRRLGPRGVEDATRAAALDVEARELVAAAADAATPVTKKAHSLRAEAAKVEQEAKVAAERDEAEFGRTQDALKRSMRPQVAKRLSPLLAQCLRSISEASAMQLVEACAEIDDQVREELGIKSDDVIFRGLGTAALELAGAMTPEKARLLDEGGILHEVALDRTVDFIGVLRLQPFSTYAVMRAVVGFAEYIAHRRASAGLAALSAPTAPAAPARARRADPPSAA